MRYLFRNPFEGHVYVKGLYDQKECRNDEGGRQVQETDILNSYLNGLAIN